MVRRGFRNQEAPQAYGEEEAPQAAEEDAGAAPQARQVAGRYCSPRPVRLGVARGTGSDGDRRLAGRRCSLCPQAGRRPGGRARARALGPARGVDGGPPRAELGRVRFVRADIRNPVIAKVIAAEGVDTVVHTGVVATPGSAGGRSSMKEINVIGTMQLLAACQKAPGVAKLVVKSSTTVYGAGPRDPALFTEEMAPRAIHQTGLSKDAVEVEGYVRGFARRRPDVCVSTLRMADWIGPTNG